eukprot:4946974-Pyramimonas_sp.AAC.1
MTEPLAPNCHCHGCPGAPARNRHRVPMGRSFLSVYSQRGALPFALSPPFAAGGLLSPNLTARAGPSRGTCFGRVGRGRLSLLLDAVI